MTATNDEPVVDTTTTFGAHAAERLRSEKIGWLTTVGGSGTPQPNPVWFLWHDGDLLVLSRPGQAKLRNIARNPRVSLHLNSAAHGGDIVVLTGNARLDDGLPTTDETAALSEKYADVLESVDLTAQGFYATYSALVRITPDRLRGF